jgi:hypothetical protein
VFQFLTHCVAITKAKWRMSSREMKIVDTRFKALRAVTVVLRDATVLHCRLVPTFVTSVRLEAASYVAQMSRCSEMLGYIDSENCLAKHDT